MKPKHGMGNGLGDVTIMLGKIGCRNNNRSWSLQINAVKNVNEKL